MHGFFFDIGHGKPLQFKGLESAALAPCRPYPASLCSCDAVGVAVPRNERRSQNFPVALPDAVVVST